MKRKGGIAFFDSGIGGLTVLNACKKRLPDSLFYYYGDNKHAPYGNLPSGKIRKYVLRAFKRFEKMQVRAAVVACNTATAVCIEELREKFSFPIIGAEPAVFPAMREGGEVFVLTTRATYESARFRRLCKNAEALYPSAKLTAFPCDKLAGEIEKCIFDTGDHYTALLPQGQPTSVVLGCTHYVYISELVRSFYRCPVFDGNEGIACQVERVLRANYVFEEHRQPLENHLQPFCIEKQFKKEKNGRKCEERPRRECLDPRCILSHIPSYSFL